MMETKRYRAAMIGSGNRGMALRNTMQRAERVDVACASDPMETNFNALKEDGVAVYTDFQTMLAKESPDIVVIATPIATHYEVAKRAFQFPMSAMYLEKAMATRLDEADELVELSEANDVRFIVGHQLRYTRDWANARNMIDDDMIGEVTLLRGRRGAALLTHHTHQTDLMRYYVSDSPVSWVIGQIHRDGSHLSERMESETQSLAYVQFENGVSGIIESGAYGPNAGNYIMIVGERGEIRVGSDSRYRSEDTGGEWRPIPDYDQPNIFDDLVSWMEGGPKHRCAADSGRATLEVLLAVYESSRSRGRVELPLQKRGNALQEMLADGTLN